MLVERDTLAFTAAASHAAQYAPTLQLYPVRLAAPDGNDTSGDVMLEGAPHPESTATFASCWYRTNGAPPESHDTVTTANAALFGAT